MLNIARLPDMERRDLFRATAQKMQIHEAIVEKDFWVCWVLKYLFESSNGFVQDENVNKLKLGKYKGTFQSIECHKTL